MTAGLLALNEPILRLMNSPEDLMGDVMAYMGIIYAGLIVTAAYNSLGGVPSGIGGFEISVVFPDHFCCDQCNTGCGSDQIFWNGSGRLCLRNSDRSGNFGNMLSDLYSEKISDSSSGEKEF